MNYDLRGFEYSDISNFFVKTLDRDNELIDFLSFNLNSFNVLSFDFKYLDLKISFSEFILNFGIDYLIDKTTTFYHYFFKIEVLKYADYYHIEIKNEFDKIYKNREIDKLLFEKYFDLKGILYKNSSVFFQSIYINNSNSFIFARFRSYSLSYQSHYNYVQILNLEYPKTFYIQFRQVSFEISELSIFDKIYDLNAFEDNKILEFEKFILFIYKIGIICFSKNDLFNILQSNFLNFLNFSIETILKLPYSVSSINYKNSLVSIDGNGSLYQDNRELKVKNYNQGFRVIFSFFVYFKTNKKHIIYFLENILNNNILILIEELIRDV